MGWSAGGSLLDDVLAHVEDYLPSAERKSIVLKLIDLFEGMDADTIFDQPESETLKEIKIDRYGEEDDDW